MEIKIGNHKLAPKIIQKQVCPAGTAYYQIDYQLDGVTVYSAHVGPVWGSPSPIEALDYEASKWDKRQNRELIMSALEQIA